MATTTQRGLGWTHRQRRAQLVPRAIGRPCPGTSDGRRSPRCVGIMTDPRLMDLDHTTPRALGGHIGDRVCCRYCNRWHGARLGNALRRTAVTVTTLRW